MNDISGLIHRGAAFVYSTFVVTSAEADRFARQYVELIEAKDHVGA